MGPLPTMRPLPDTYTTFDTAESTMCAQHTSCGNSAETNFDAACKSLEELQHLFFSLVDASG